MIEIGYKPGFIREFQKLEPALQQEVREKIELFKDKKNHEHLKVHKLKGSLKDRWSFSINYRYRIVFQWIDEDSVVLLAVGDHDVYK